MRPALAFVMWAALVVAVVVVAVAVAKEELPPEVVQGIQEAWKGPWTLEEYKQVLKDNCPSTPGKVGWCPCTCLLNYVIIFMGFNRARGNTSASAASTKCSTVSTSNHMT